MADSHRTCPLCEDAAEIRSDGIRDSFWISCRRCGEYKISEEAVDDKGVLERVRPFLSAATRQASENRKPLMLTTKTVVEEARVHRETSPSTRLDKTLLYLARTPPGQLTTIKLSHDFTVVSAGSSGEFSQYVDYLQEKGLVVKDGRGGSEFQVMLTVPGRLAVEPLLAAGGTPGVCFIAMWFDPSMEEVYDNGFDPGVRDAGYKPHRIDQASTNKGISDTILAAIRTAEFVVADFTGQRQSVYFEAGFARGLGREVIWCCRADQVKDLHFDTKHLGHVAWNDANDLRKKLADSIRANIIRPKTTSGLLGNR